MRPQPTSALAAPPADLTLPDGVLVLSGYGLDIRVWRGRLRVADGIGRARREGLVHRATGRLRRLVILGHTGAITLDAIRWLADVGAGVVQIDEDGRVLAAFGPLGTDRPTLRRRQATALDTSLGVDIARRLVAEKVAAQSLALAALSHHVAVDDPTVAAMSDAARRLHVAVTRDEVRLAEAVAAAVYWSAWSTLPVAFARRDAAAVPPHWRTVGTRSSPLTASPRLAANPANAILNYLYALLEGEATIAARVVGLDPGLGVLHADQLNRDSLATDLMEPVRPLVDQYVLRLLAARTFAPTDFYETRQGVCRVTPPLAKELARTIPEWRRAVGRVAEDVARWLVADHAAERLPTPLSGRNRSEGRGTRRRVRPARGHSPARGCAWCGSPTPAGRRTCSTGCADAVAADNVSRYRAEGWPEKSPEGRERIAARAVSTVAAARAWQRTQAWPADMAAFEREILPGLAEVPARVLAEATGLSAGYCQRVKAGQVRPHPMWWEQLRALGR